MWDKDADYELHSAKRCISPPDCDGFALEVSFNRWVSVSNFVDFVFNLIQAARRV